MYIYPHHKEGDQRVKYIYPHGGKSVHWKSIKLIFAHKAQAGGPLYNHREDNDNQRK